MNRRQALTRTLVAAVTASLSGVTPRILYADNHSPIDYALSPELWVDIVDHHRFGAITFAKLRANVPITGNENSDDFQEVFRLINKAFTRPTIAVLLDRSSSDKDAVRTGMRERSDANRERLVEWFDEVNVPNPSRIVLLESQAVFAALFFLGLHNADPSVADDITWTFPYCFSDYA